MDPTGASVAATTPPVHFLNIEYVFYLLYQWLTGSHGTGLDFSGLIHLLTTLWVVVTIIAYLLALGFLGFLVHSIIRMHQIKDADAARYATVHDAHAAEEITEHHRWAHVRQLIESPQENDWRQAIIEADIILEDMLTRLGYPGQTVADKLKAADPARFTTLQEAWEAHKVRNDIAHRGSTFPLTDHLAYRTILHYENVFKEHGEI